MLEDSQRHGLGRRSQHYIMVGKCAQFGHGGQQPPVPAGLRGTDSYTFLRPKQSREGEGEREP